MSFSIAQLTAKAGAHVTNAIQSASARTGVGFEYLLQQANAESSFQTDVKAKTSSATGLFQFIDKTWLSMIDKYGAQHGVDTTLPKQDLLALRKDPDLSSLMAAELAAENKAHMQKVLGADTKIGATEQYLGHFMGAGKAAAFLKAYEETPHKPAADIFTKEAGANYNVFYNSSTGQPRSFTEVYAFFDKKFGASSNQNPSAQTPEKPSYTGSHEGNLLAASRSEKSNRQLAQDILSIQSQMTFDGAFKSPIMREGGSRFPTNNFGNIAPPSPAPTMGPSFGNFLQNPADILWLALLDDKLDS